MRTRRMVVLRVRERMDEATRHGYIGACRRGRGCEALWRAIFQKLDVGVGNSTPENKN